MINLIDWTRNVAKSTVYSTAEVLSDNFSVAKDFKETNSELFKETYSSIKNYRTTFKRIKNTIEKSDIYVAANVAARNIVEDIKTGNFYNTSREEEINEKYGGISFNDEEWDIDSNDFDWEDKNISDGEKIIAGAIKKNGKVNSIILSDTIAKTTNASIDASRENTTLLYLQNERLLGSINKSFDSLKEFAQRNVERDIKLQNNRDKKFDKFFSRIEENTNKIVAELDELVKLQRNVVLGPEVKEKTQKTTAIDIINDGAIDLKAYGKNIANNIFEQLNQSFGGMLSSLSNMKFGEGGNMFAAMAANPTKEIVQDMIKNIIPQEYKEITSQFNESMSGWVSTLISRFNDLANNGDREIDRILGNIFGIKTKKAPKSIDTSKYKKGPISFDGITKKSITEVIPYYLRKMTSVLTGEEEKVFDFEAGKWTTLRKVKENQKDNLLNKYMQGTSNIETIIKESTGEYSKMYRSKSQQKKFDKDMEKFRIAVYNNGGNIGEVLNNPFFYGIDEDHANFLKKIFKSYRDQYYTNRRTINGKRGPRSVVSGIDRTKGADGIKTGKDISSLLFGISGQIMKREQQQIDFMKKLEENADSVQRLLYSEDININSKSGYQITNQYGDLDQKKAFNSPLVKAMMIMKDEYNYTLFDYLRGIKKDLSAIRNNNISGILFGTGNSTDTDNLMNFENSIDYFSQNHIYDNFSSNVNYRLGNYNEKEEKKQKDKEKESFKTSQTKRETYARERMRGYRPFAADESSQLGRYFQSYQMYLSRVNEKYHKIEEAELGKIYRELVDLDLITDTEAKKYNSIKFDPEKPFKEQMKNLTSTGERLALIRSYAVNVSEKPFHAVDDALVSLNDWMTQIFFGDQLDKNNDKEESSKEDSIFGIIKNRFKRGFEDIGKIVSDKLAEIIDGPFQKLREKVLVPFKEFLIGHREKSTDPFSGGLFGDLIESIRTSWNDHTKADLARWATEDKAKLKEAITGKEEDITPNSYTNTNSNQYKSVLTDEERELLSKIKNIKTDRIEKIVDKDVIIEESNESRNEKSRFILSPDSDSGINGYISQFNGHIDGGLLNIPVNELGSKYEIPALIWKEFKANPQMLELLGAKINNDKITNIKLVGNNFYNYLTWCSAVGYNALQSLSPNIIREYMNSEFKKWIDSTKGNKYKISNVDIILFKQLSAQQGRLAQETAQRRNALGNEDINESILNEIYRKNSNTVKVKSSDNEERNNKTIRGIMTRDPKCKELIDRYEIDIDEYIKWCNNNPKMDFYTKLDPNTLLTYCIQVSYTRDQASKITGFSQIDKLLPEKYKEVKRERLDSVIEKIINNEDYTEEEKKIKIDNIKKYYSKQYGDILEEYEKDNESKKQAEIKESNINRNTNILNRILNPLQEISDNLKKLVSYFDNGFTPATNTPEVPPLFARGGINLTGKPFKSIVSSGEIINGNIVPPGGPYITTIPENGIVINPADENTINKQSTQETNFLNKLKQNSEANDGLRPIFNSISDFNKKHSESIGDAIVRGGLGFGAGFLLGNPLLGAALGSISSFANKTNEFASMLFGDAIVNEEGKVIDRKDNGLISNEILKAAPDMRLGGLIGTIGGLFTPFGPVGGLLIGSALGFVKKNELIQDSLFGTNGLIDKDKLEKALPSMGVGATLGSLVLTGMGSPLGLVGNALVGSAVGFATTTDSFKEIVLGEEDGDNKRHGGIVGILKTAMNPMKNFVNTMIEATMTAIFGKKVKEGEDGPETRKGGLFGAFKDMVIKPAAESVDPIVQEIKNTISKTFNFADQLFDKIGFNKQHFVDRVGNLFNSLGQIAITTAKLGLWIKQTPLMLGAQALKQTGLHFRRKQIRRGEAYNMTAQERLDDRDKHKLAYKLGSGFESLRNGIINTSRELNGKEALSGDLYDRYLRNDKTLASMSANLSVDELEQIAGALRYDSTNSDEENILAQEKQYRTALDEEAMSITKGMKNNHKFVSKINSLAFSGRGNEAIELINKNSDLSDDQKQNLIVQVNKYMNHSKSIRANYSISKNMQKDLSDRLKKLGLDVDLTDKKDKLRLAKNIQTEIISKSKGLNADQLEKMQEWRDEANPAVQQVKILKEIFKVLSGKNVDTINEEEENNQEEVLKKRFSRKAKDIINRSENGEKLSKFEEEELNNAKQKAKKILDGLDISNSELTEDELLKRYIEEEIVKSRMSRVQNSKSERSLLSEIQKTYRSKQKKLEEMSSRNSDKDYIDFGVAETNDELDKNNEQINDEEYIERVKNSARKKKVKDNEEYSSMIEESNSNGILSRLQNNNEQNFFKRIATSGGSKISNFFKFGKKKNKKNREFISDIDNDSTKYNIKLNSKEKEKISEVLTEKGNNESEIKRYIKDITSRELNRDELKNIKDEFNINPKIRKTSILDIAKNAKTNDKLTEYSNEIDNINIDSEDDKDENTSILGKIGRKNKKKSKSNSANNILGVIKNISGVLIKPIANLVEITETIKDKMDDVKEKSQGIKYWISKIFGISKFVVGVPLLVSFLNKHIIPFVKDKLSPILIGTKDSDGNYQNGILSSVINPIKNKFGEKIDTIKNWLTNKGEYEDNTKGLKGAMTNLFSSWKDGVGIIVDSIMEKIMPKLEDIGAKIGIGIAKAWSTGWENVGASMADRDLQYDKYRNAVDPNQIRNYMVNSGKDPNNITQQDLNEYYTKLGYNPEDVNKYTESHNINPTNFAFSTNAKANDKLTPFINRTKKSNKNDLINWVFQSTSFIDDLYSSNKINEFKKLYQTNNSIDNKIDDGTITPMDKEYWNIKVNNNGDPLINSLYKMKESFNRLVKSPFSLVASSIGDVVGTVSTNSGESTQSANNYSNSSLGQTSTVSSSSNSSSKISTSASTTSTSQTKKTSSLFSKIGNGIKNIAKKIFGKGKYGRGYGDHIYQRDYSGSYQTSGDTETQTIADSGCGPAAAAAVLNQYGMNGNMNNAVNYALKGGFKEINGGTYPDYFDSYLNNNGIQTQTVYDNNDVVNSLVNGKPVIMMGQDKSNSGETPYGSDYSHYVVATGLDNNGNVIVEDSEDPNGSTIYDLNETLNNTSVKIATGMGKNKNSKFGRAKQTIMDRFIGNVTNAIYTPYLMYSATLQNAMNDTYTSNNNSTNNISRNSNTSNNTSSGSLSTSSQDYKGSGAIGNGGGNNTEANRKAVWRWFRSKGFTKEATAGIIGNMERETRIHTNEQSKSYNVSGAVTNGIIQWDPFSKHENFCKKNNISDPFDLEGQLMHILYSIQNEWLDNGTRYDYSKYKYVSSEEFPHLTDVELAAIAFERGVEGCSGYFGKWGIPFAQKTYNMLAASDGAEDIEVSTGKGIVNHIRNKYGRGSVIPKDDISITSNTTSTTSSSNNVSNGSNTSSSTKSTTSTSSYTVPQVTSEGKAEVTFGGLSDLLKGYMSALFPGTFSSNNTSSSSTTNTTSSTSTTNASTNGTNGKLNPDSDVKTTCGYTATQLKNAIKAIHPEGCSAEQFPDAAIAVEKSKGVNALFTIAVGILEHGWNGVVGINTTHGNYGNWNVFNIQGQPNSSNGRWKDYNSLTDAFEGFANLIMGSGYYGAGLTTPAKIGNRYCPPTAAENASYGPWGEAVCRVANTIADRISTSGKGISRRHIYGKANENNKEQKKKTTTSINPNAGIISKLADYAGNAMKKTYGAYYYTIFGDEGVYSKQENNSNNISNNNLYVTKSNNNSSSSNSNKSNSNSNNNIINTAMKIFYKTGPTVYGSYTTIELDGETYKVRCDCSGYVSTIIKAMGYKLVYANGSPADMLNSSAFGTSGCSKYIKNKDGSDTNDWEDIPFSVSALKPGDIIAHPGHVEIYWFTNSSGRIRGFSAGATEGILSSYNSSKNYIENKNIDNGTYLYTNHTRILRYKHNNGIPVPSGSGRGKGKGIINKIKNNFSKFGRSDNSKTTVEQNTTSNSTNTKKKGNTTLGNETSLMTKLGEYIGNSVKKTYGAYYYTLFGDESSSASQTSSSSNNNQNSSSNNTNTSNNGDAKSYNPNATILAPFDGYFWISSMYDPTGAWSKTRGGAHGGIDIIACTEKGIRRTNAPIYSLCSGTVVHAGWENANNHSQGFGQYVSVQDSNGDKWYYGHMSSVTVTTGQQVSVGTQLGCMGTTGSSTGDHTHFEIRPSSGGTKDVAAFMNLPQKFDAFNTYNATSEVLSKGYPYVFYSDVFKSGTSSSTGTGKGKNKHLVNIKSEYGRAYNKYNRSIRSNPASLEKMREYSIDSRRIKTNKQITEDIRRFNNNPNNNSLKTTTDIDKYGVNAISPAEVEIMRNSKKSGKGKNNNELTDTLLTNLINIVTTIANNVSKTDQIIQLLTAIVTNTAIKENKSNKQNQQLLQLINQINASSNNTNSAPLSSMDQIINNNGKSISDAVYNIARG